MGSIVSRTLSVGQEHELLQKLEAAGLNAEDAQWVINSPKNGAATLFIKLIRAKARDLRHTVTLVQERLAVQALERIRDRAEPDLAKILDHVIEEVTGRKECPSCLAYSVAVDYGQNLDQMIEAGHYNATDPNITDRHFHVDGKGKSKVNVELIHYGRAMSTDAVLEDMDQRGFRPAKIEELLALGAARPDLQREYPIIALSSVWRQPVIFIQDTCAYLWADESHRYLYLCFMDDHGSECRFAAVRKSDDQRPEHVYRVTVDRDKKLREMIEAGCYDYAHHDIIDKNFPVKGSGLVGVNIELVHYGYGTSTTAVLKDLDDRGLRPIRIEELLALGAYPTARDLQRQFPIIALGSMWQDSVGDRHCPALAGSVSWRRLVLNWYDNGWRAAFRFGAVREDSGSL